MILVQAFLVLGAVLISIIIGGLILIALWVLVEEAIEAYNDYQSYKLEKYDEL